jgi:nucleotide-binding universal stress UspA family protein
MLRVVVGVDAAGRSKAALVRALREAQLRDARLEAVHVFDPDDRDLAERVSGPLTAAWKPDGAGAIFESSDAPREDAATVQFRSARQQAARRLAAATEDALGSEGTRLVRGVLIPANDVAQALVDHAEGADLLVIGVRQRTPVGKLILGSDARDVILHATVPVLAVPDQS